MTQGWLGTTDFRRVPIRSIKINDDRGRQEFTRIREMSESIKEKGLINPLLVVVDRDDPDKFVLVAGERRYRGAVIAGLTEVPVTFSDNLTPLQQKALELEENICRRDLAALEEADLMRQLDDLRREENPNWTQQDTAEFVGASPGHVSLQIKVAKAINADPELKAKVKNLDIRSAEKVINRAEQVKKMERLQAQGAIEVPSIDLRYGGCLEHLPSLEDNSIDLVVTDPPFGADKFNELRTGGYSPGAKLMSDTHNMDLVTVLALLRDVTKELVRVVKPGGHIYVFAPQQHISHFIDALDPLLFQYPPLVWDRKRSTQPGYGYNYMNRTETILYFHNPPRGKRLAKNMVNVFECDEVSRTNRQFHTEKPQSLLRIFIEQSSILGETVLDPFAGSASTLLSAKGLGRKAIGFEVDEETYKRAVLKIAGKDEEE